MKRHWALIFVSILYNVAFESTLGTNAGCSIDQNFCSFMQTSVCPDGEKQTLDHIIIFLKTRPNIDHILALSSGRNWKCWVVCIHEQTKNYSAHKQDTEGARSWFQFIRPHNLNKWNEENNIENSDFSDRSWCGTNEGDESWSCHSSGTLWVTRMRSMFRVLPGSCQSLSFSVRNSSVWEVQNSFILAGNPENARNKISGELGSC